MVQQLLRWPNIETSFQLDTITPGEFCIVPKLLRDAARGGEWDGVIKSINADLGPGRLKNRDDHIHHVLKRLTVCLSSTYFILQQVYRPLGAKVSNLPLK